jgi:CheY-like chemotaxis protein
MTYVLVVDDEPPICQLLTRWLKSWGYATKQAMTAPDALEAMMAEPAAIVLCDIRMPGRDGLWLVDQLRARWPKTAIIMATGVDDMQTVMRTREQGVVDYVVKPYGRELVRQALRRAEAGLTE